jgi:hypothetical protein
MKRHPPLIALSHDHHHTLVMARRLRRAGESGGGDPTSRLADFARRPHPRVRTRRGMTIEFLHPTRSLQRSRAKPANACPSDKPESSVVLRGKCFAINRVQVLSLNEHAITLLASASAAE